jgi:voltage-gated potassium channel
LEPKSDKGKDKLVSKIEKKAKLAVSQKKKKKHWKNKIYNYSILGIALIGVIFAVIDMFKGLTDFQRWIDLGIRVILAADYFVRLFRAEDKKLFFLENIFNLIAILPYNTAIWIFGPLRLIKAAKFTIIGAFPKKAFNKIKIIINTNSLKTMIILTLAAMLLGSIGIMYTEKMSFGDSVWWAFVTATTVGYGDLSPKSSLGRLIAAGLMIFGIGLISSITSTITSYFLNRNTMDYKEETLELIKRKIDDVSNLSDEDIDAICKVLKTLNK